MTNDLQNGAATAKGAVQFRLADAEAFQIEAGRGNAMASSVYMMLLITDGVGHGMLENKKTALAQGACLMLHPQAICRLEAGVIGMTGYRFEFEMSGLQHSSEGKTGLETLDEWLASWTHEFGASAAGMLLEAEHLHRSRNEADELERLDRQIRFQSLLLSMLRAYRSAAAGEQSLRQAVGRSVEYVRAHYAQPLSIGRLAEMTATNRWRYTQLFKEETGQLPIDFLNTVRIDKAQEMLLLTGDKLKQIALAVGYSNEYYFNRKFKQKVGITPGQYRSRNTGKTRVFAPFLEDYLVALGVTPILQFFHRGWGRQEYLGLYGVPDFDIAVDDWTVLSSHQPDFILLNDGHRRWNLERYSRISPVFKIPFAGEDWRLMLRSIGNVLGRQQEATAAVERLERQIAEARFRLGRTSAKESVAVLRISGQSIALYGGGACGYTGPLLYRGLGLTEPDIVRRMASGVRRVNLSLEELKELDADHLFVTFEGHGEGRELLDSDVWQSLPAVRAGRAYEVDFLAWMNYGVLSHSRKISDVLQAMGR
ncbi:ABC-type Fe3+-hydroxamate transport system, substrate-binding protein [Cohnella sp. OV330]|uniref:AraC family transcriptional regulator n=1 Tax=Cohnella sp. OV330 TaxID=1855288 RepID=UPI0008E3C1C9|nr:AraC family transcriptional regulator [Cohnella sp. OV330]SFB39331.1 ABC-type Fe3+-hydroxamate transport system, substrate-binding protein [Cohnella sp. OV330]